MKPNLRTLSLQELSVLIDWAGAGGGPPASSISQVQGTSPGAQARPAVRGDGVRTWIRSGGAARSHYFKRPSADLGCRAAHGRSA